MNLNKYKNRKVVLVDEQDNELGVGSLVEAHQGEGQKHRAFSLVLYRKSEGKIEVLLQKRAKDKPVFAHYWANTCCYNMAPGEEYLSRAVSRVKEEMGVEVRESALCKLYQFSYYAPDPSASTSTSLSASSGQVQWCENELDQVIVGEWNPSAGTSTSLSASSGQAGEIVPNPEEVEEYRWLEWGEMKEDVKNNPEIYAPWWKMIVEDRKVEEEIYGRA